MRRVLTRKLDVSPEALAAVDAVRRRTALPTRDPLLPPATRCPHLARRMATRRCLLCLLVAGIVACVPAAAPAQVVTGVVTDGDTGEPVPAAQVVAEGTTRGALTDEGGRYRLSLEGLTVPAAGWRLTARSFGYGEASRTVRVDAGDTEAVDFALSPGPLTMDAVVVADMAFASGSGSLQDFIDNLQSLAEFQEDYPDFPTERVLAAYLSALEAEQAEMRALRRHRVWTFRWQFFSSILLFMVVLGVVLTGLLMSWRHFQAQVAGPAPGAGDAATEVEMSTSRLAVSSRYIGVVIFVVSLAFFFLYLRYVYPIQPLDLRTTPTEAVGSR